MPSLRAIQTRKAEIQQAVAGLQARSDDLTDADFTAMDGLEQELTSLAEAEKRQTQLILLDRAAAGKPLNGPVAPGRMEVRAFASALSPVPTGFDGTLLHGQDGTLRSG
jgi:hypothetical protein